MTPAPPPDSLGQRLLPSVVDELASTDPNRILYSIARTKDPGEGFQDVTVQQFAQAVDRCAWHIEESLGHGDNFPTLAYMGPQDAMYAVLVLAVIKTGYKLLLNSPRNSLEAHLSLLETTKCNVFLLPPKFPLPVVGQILSNRQMKVLEIPLLQHWLHHDDVPHRPYPYEKTYKDSHLEPFVVLHTSGSTGLPKPIVQSHGTISPLDAFAALPDQGLPETYPAMCKGKRVYLAFPLFHCAGISMLLPGAIFNGFTVVLGPFPPSAEVANSIHVNGNVQHSCLAPMTLIDLVKDPEHLKNLQNLEQITYGGGPCPEPVGNLIAERTRLLNCLGTTECGVLPIQLCGQNDWSYMSVSPALGHEYRQVSDDLYEQVIVRRPELDLYQGIFKTFPELQEWPMKDLYTKHPVKENQWLYKGRSDDIIVFSTGEKLNPVDMESIISANPEVTAALISGQGCVQSSLLVETTQPPQSETEASKILDAIWPSVEAANKISPTHGRIHRHMVMFTSAEKPMLKAGKGTVQRKLTVELYEKELASLYKASERPSLDPKVFSGQSLEDAVRAIIASSTDISVGKLDTNTDLFEYGLDSLQAMAITRHINSLLAARNKPSTFETKAVYSNPTLASLISFISGLIDERADSNSNGITPEMLYKQFAVDLPISARKPDSNDSGKLVFLLTGSTGSLGSYILHSLAENPKVDRVYCLNRNADSNERQKKSQLEKGLPPLPDDKVTYLEASLARPYFGLDKATYWALLEGVTNVIHNAWQVDFNLSLASFTNQIIAVKRLIDFSVHSRLGAKLFFVSSISTVTEVAGHIEEAIYREGSPSQKIGYAQSKYVAELLLDDAARHARVPATICRVGQIAGPVKTPGTWPEKEWFPSLISSSKYLGKIPASLGPANVIDWVPVDVVSDIVTELTTKDSQWNGPGAAVFHAVNPSTLLWADLLPHIGSLEAVSLQDWVSALRESASESVDFKMNPAIKLVDFFDDLSRWEGEIKPVQTKLAKAESPSLAQVGPIQFGWVRKWLSCDQSLIKRS